MKTLSKIPPLLLTSLFMFSGCFEDGKAPYSDVEGGAVYSLQNQQIVAPVSKATLSIAAHNPNLVLLDGSLSTKSSSSELSYKWNILSKPDGSNATLSDSTIVNPTFLTDVAGTYEIELVVKDAFYKSEEKLLKVITVGGNVVDGPIYGARVVLMDMNNTILGETVTSAEDAKVGNYSLAVKNLPSEYILKIIGGKDTGADGKIDADDVESFEMSSVGVSSNPNTFVSPATTLITHLVESGVTLENARQNISNALGLPASVNITTTNPKNNEVASKAGTFIAQVLHSLPSSNTTHNLNAIAKVFSLQGESNTSVVTITNANVELKSLNLKDIADEVNLVTANSISQENLQKLETTQSLLAKKIVSTTKKTKAIASQTSVEKKEAIAAQKALKSLNKEITNALEVDLIDLELFSTKLEEGFYSVIDTNETSLNANNLDIVAQVIKTNLDKNSSTIASQLSSIAQNTRDLNASLVGIYKDIYSTIDINQTSKVNNLNKEDILTLVSQTNEQENKQLLQSSLTSKIISLVKTSTQSIESSTLQTLQSSILNNTLLSDTLVELQLNTTHAKEQKINNLLANLLDKNLQKNSFIFDETAKNTLASLKEKLENLLILEDETKTQIELEDSLRAIELTINLVDLSTAYNEESFNTSFQNVKEIVSKLREQNNITLNVAFTISLHRIEVELQKQTLTAEFILEHIQDYIVKSEKHNSYIESLQIPNIGGFRLPDFEKIEVTTK